MRFAYTRRGGPLLDWSGVTPPQQSRAGETRSLGDFYPTTRNSNALRRNGGPGAPKGAAIGYEHNRRLGYWGSDIGGGSGSGYRPAPGMGDLPIPLPGAPEIIEGYESPAPGAAIIHLGNGYPWDQKYPGQTSLSGYMPEGAARSYGQTMLAADAPAKTFDMGLVRKASALAAGYHGVKRNNGSIFWGLLWAAAAFITPLYGTLVPAFAAAQGFGRPRGPIQNPAKTRKIRAMGKKYGWKYVGRRSKRKNKRSSRR
jgi:hypothetical protein